MLKDNFKKLNTIIDNTRSSMSQSIDEVKEISNFASVDYSESEAEYLRLKFESEEFIKHVDDLKARYIAARKKLRNYNMNHHMHTDKELEEQYKEADKLRVLLVVEEQKEVALRKRRNDLEVHLKTVREVLSKSERARSNFEMALSIISGELQKLTKDIGEFENKEIWGMRVIEAEEKERQRIARDLHDGPAQNLANLLLKTEVCLKLMETDLDKTRKEMLVLKKNLKDTINETRAMIYNLRPMSIDDLGLVPTIERYVEKIKDDTGLDILLKIQGMKYYRNTLYKESVVLTIFRIVQESISNSIKYSKCTKIEVTLSFLSDKILLKIVDNGIGFEVDDVALDLKTSSGFGLSMMKERANLLNSEFEISSVLGKGTEVALIIYLEKKMEVKNG